MSFDKNDFTWGYEIEWGDIDRRLEIPEHLGSWEYSETDIVNLNPPYQYVACDPRGESPPFGGEINTKPTSTWQDQADRVMELHDIFVANGDTPTASVVNHGHLHVFVPGLKEDIASLKKLIAYVAENQEDTVEACYGFYDHHEMKSTKGAKMYLKYDGGRQMPEYMSNNIINLATDFNHFIKLHAAGKDGVSMGRPFRYAINTYCMKHTGTIEFRCFRSTTKREEVESQFRFACDFIDAALNDGPSVAELLSMNNYTFPPFVWNLEEYAGWLETKYVKERGIQGRGTKVRTYNEVA
jgi:hypothetical protein